MHFQMLRRFAAKPPFRLGGARSTEDCLGGQIITLKGRDVLLFSQLHQNNIRPQG